MLGKVLPTTIFGLFQALTKNLPGMRLPVSVPGLRIFFVFLVCVSATGFDNLNI
jgi:hypothetical protein